VQACLALSTRRMIERRCAAEERRRALAGFDMWCDFLHLARRAAKDAVLREAAAHALAEAQQVTSLAEAQGQGQAQALAQGQVEALGEAVALLEAESQALNPTPYTLNPTPYILNPTPYTLNPEP